MDPSYSARIALRQAHIVGTAHLFASGDLKSRPTGVPRPLLAPSFSQYACFSGNSDGGQRSLEPHSKLQRHTHRMHNFWCTVYSCQCFKHLESLHGCEEHGFDPVAAQCHVAAGAVGTQSGGTQGTRLGSQPSAHSAGPNRVGYVVGSTRACRKMPSSGKRWNSTTSPTQTLLAAQK